MTVAENKRAVGVFSNRQDAETALDEVNKAGFPIDRVSVITTQAKPDDQLAGANMSDRIGDEASVTAATKANANTNVGLFGGIFTSLSTLAVPGVGAVMAAGGLGLTLAGTIAGVGIGTAATNRLIEALTDLGIHEDDAKVYSDRLFYNYYLVIVDGTDEEIAKVEGVFRERGIQDWAVYNRPNDSPVLS
ncbi:MULTISPECIES: general stress protein [unclassified Coleofasciculus]|uniref:general stress protein n=1 Tax=Cyanophyceae TaxID=3028117 RepID=UPI001688A9E8|nr:MULTISPECIES: general stress protein [unclassified Coleofasciculus]MBD1880877.1 hypothetical protein [Coleofasciculus sp. FACHB-T130]MBD1891343.1 hypothetical protein [Coleofasciculus sp. FACHB-SPT9]MBD2086879.1 hypothetical protein [Coleofasciculus sp. FACHB-542]MBD2541359.1 hypothetical protein [Coleofasciculus sp. FACHB-SPT36]